VDDQTMNRYLTEKHRFFSLGLRKHPELLIILDVNVEAMCAEGEVEAKEFDRKFAEAFEKRGNYLLLQDYECILMEAPPTFANDMGAKLKDASVDFVGTFTENDGKYQYSLRSLKPDFSVLEICMKKGGGGQKGAAGFTSNEPEHALIIR